MSHPTHPADALILAAAKRDRGFSVQPLVGRSDKAVANRCEALAAAGKLHKAKLSHRVVRWYDTAERAQAAMDKAHVDRARMVTHASASKPRMLDQSSEGIITAATKFTVCPSNPPRFQTASPIQFGLQRGRVMR